MKCKICGATHHHQAMGIAGIAIPPACPCGKLRSRERAKGCPKCGSKADHEHPVLNLRLVKKAFRKPYYEMKCDICGHTWKVEP